MFAAIIYAVKIK